MSNEVSKSDEGICNPWVSFFENKKQRKRGLALAIRFLGDPFEAEDVIQDASMRVIRHPDKVDMPNYFLKTVTNLCLSRLVRRSRLMITNARPLDRTSTEESEEVPMQIQDRSCNPEVNEERKEKNQRLLRMVQSRLKLTDREKALFLNHLKGYTNKEIADAWCEDVKKIQKEMNAVLTKMRHRLKRRNENKDGQ